MGGAADAHHIGGPTTQRVRASSRLVMRTRMHARAPRACYLAPYTPHLRQHVAVLQVASPACQLIHPNRVYVMLTWLPACVQAGCLHSSAATGLRPHCVHQLQPRHAVREPQGHCFHAQDRALCCIRPVPVHAPPGVWCVPSQKMIMRCVRRADMKFMILHLGAVWLLHVKRTWRVHGDMHCAGNL